jgi:hypothetical protein
MGYPGSATHGGFAERSADRVVDAALAWLDSTPQRFFLWVHLYDPHANYEPPPPHQPAPQRSPNPAKVGFLRAVAGSVKLSYAGEVAFCDAPPMSASGDSSAV